MSSNDILSYESLRRVALEIVQLGRDVPEEEWFEDAEHYATSLIRRLCEEAYDDGRRQGELSSLGAMRHSKRLDRQNTLVRSDVFIHRLEPDMLEALRRALEHGLTPCGLEITGGDDDSIVVLRFVRPTVPRSSVGRNAGDSGG